MNRTMPRAAILLLPAVGAAALAQNQALVLEGDIIPGVGLVTDVTDLVVNDSGGWIARVDTDHPDTLADEVLLKNGTVLIREGDPLAGPVGATFDSVVSLVLTNQGESAWVLNALAPFEGIYFGMTPSVLEGDVCDDPTLLPGTYYSTPFDAEMNDARQILTTSFLQKPAIPGNDYALVRIQVDGSGAVVSEQVLLKETDALPGSLGSVVSLPLGQKDFAINAAGDVLFKVQGTDGSGVMLNATLLAEDGALSPVFGAEWGNLSKGSVALGAGGDFAFCGTLDTPLDKTVLVWNGVKLARSGDVLQPIAPFKVQVPLERPIFVSSGGHVLWYAEWNDPDTTRNSGFFVDQQLLVQEGVSVAEGQRLDTFGTGGFDFHASDSGRWLAFTAELDDGRKGAFLLDAQPGAVPYSGCVANQGTLASQDPLVGTANLFFTLGQSQSPTPAGYVALSTAPAQGWPPCGPALGSAGELLIDVAAPNPFAILGPAMWLTPGVTALISTPIPPDLALVGAKLYAQGLFIELGGGAQPLRLTNGLELTLGKVVP